MNNVRLDYSHFYKESKPELHDLLSKISKHNIVLVGTYLLALNKKKPFIENSLELLLKWFSNKDDFKRHGDVIINYRKAEKKKPFIFDHYSTLTLINEGLKYGNNDEKKISRIEEVLLLKAYLLINQIQDEKDTLISESIKPHFDKKHHFPLLLLTQSMRYTDVSFYSIKELLISSIVRATLLFEFIKEHYSELYEKFLSYFDVQDHQQYLKLFMSLAHAIAKSSKNNEVITINISESEDYKKAFNFFSKLQLEKSEIDTLKLDFLELRENPLFQTAENKYRIIHEVFVIEKIFNGLYFAFNHLNKKISTPVSEFRSKYTFHYSEKKAFYWTIKKIFRNKYKQFSGEDFESMKVEATPDYYIRNGNKLYIFESKDILLNADVKDSADFKLLEAEIKKKLYKKNTNSGIKPVGVKQLSNFIKKIYNDEIEFDNFKNVRIYPIIVTHNKQFNTTGLNYLLNLWFKNDLSNELDNDTKNFKVCPITVIDLSSLIYNSKVIEQIGLSKIILEYTNGYLLKNDDFSKDRLISLDRFILDKYRTVRPDKELYDQAIKMFKY